jgi:hypothetical protein
MGYTNTDMENKFLEIFIETEIINEIIVDKQSENDIYLFVGAAVLLVSIALFSASYLFKGDEVLPVEADTESLLIPLETYELGNQSSEEIEDSPPFSVISGSEFSRKVSFICEAGCSKEFKGKGDDPEIMCPYCGTIGESPL